MPAGAEVYDSAGVLIFSLGTSSVRLFDTRAIPSTDGSLTDARFATGTPFWALIPTDNSGAVYDQPVISVTGNTLSWTWPGAPRPPFSIVYGVT